MPRKILHKVTNHQKELDRRLKLAQATRSEAKKVQPGKTRRTFFNLARHWVESARWAKADLIQELNEAASEGFIYCQGRTYYQEIDDEISKQGKSASL